MSTLKTTGWVCDSLADGVTASHCLRPLLFYQSVDLLSSLIEDRLDDARQLVQEEGVLLSVGQMVGFLFFIDFMTSEQTTHIFLFPENAECSPPKPVHPTHDQAARHIAHSVSAAQTGGDISCRGLELPSPPTRGRNRPCLDGPTRGLQPFLDAEPREDAVGVGIWAVGLQRDGM